MSKAERTAACAALIGAASLALIAPVAAQDGPSGPQGSTWAEIAELPDFTTGIWEVTFGGGGFGGPALQLTPEYQAKAEEYRALELEDSPTANCVPPGMPGIMTQPYPMQFMFGPGHVAIQLEAYMQMRHIYTDGRPHPESPDPSFNGHSVGHWEGDTLVVDSVGFTTVTPLGRVWEVGHSDKMRITERISLVDDDTMEIETTVEDPEALAEPFTSTARFARHRDWTIAEYICEENNRNSFLATGEAGIDATPPDAPSE